MPYVDEIIVLVNGVVSEVGSFDGLRASKGAFSEFLETYGKEESSNADARKGLSPIQHLHFLLSFECCPEFEHILKALLRCLRGLYASAPKVWVCFSLGC